ncbi:unnamed protein product [Mytilus edulis]|uniref:Uncharacterized protein n=1 Tax=Mytilus edulis TaxID=6550 RepID=A0A8S3SDY7_MYTED|nr:unnamed protein product [Mytilus edulis]
MADSEKRLRTHTEQGAEMYETTRDKYIISLEDSWKRVDNSMNTALQKSEQKDISNARKELSRQYEIFFLKLKAKAAAARVCMEFAQKESELRKQNALLEEEQKLVNAKANASLERKKVETEANIKLLQHQKEAEVAEAEYRVLKSEIDTESDESDLTPEKLKLNGKIDPAERTAKFVSQQSQLKDTSNIEENFGSRDNWNKPGISAKKTEFKQNNDSKASQDNRCPLHKTNHSLNNCRAFRLKPLDERRKFIRDNALCFRCCSSTDHKIRDCKEKIVCGECGSDSHPSALHLVKQGNPTNNGEENHTPEVSSICTKNQPDKAIMAYIILDDQSNRSLAGPELFSLLHLKGNSSEYKLTSCAGTMNTFGRRATGLIIESLDGSTSLQHQRGDPISSCSTASRSPPGNRRLHT